MKATRKSPNLAIDPEVRKLCRDNLSKLVIRTRRERQLLTQQWIRYDNIMKTRHDSDSYHGRLRVYMASGRRIIDNWVTKLKGDLFPKSGQWFKVKAESLGSEEAVPILESLFRRYLWDYMRIRRKSGPILRQLVSLGTAPIDMGWLYRSREIPTLQRIWDESGGRMGRVEEQMKRVVEYVGPTMRPVDLFRFYVYPTSVNDVSDLSLLFEDMLLPFHTIERLGDTWIAPSDTSLGHQFENIQEARDLLAASGTRDSLEKFQAERMRLAARGLHSPVDTPEDPNRMLTCVKVYWKTDHIVDEDAPERPEGAMPWYQVTFAGDDVVLQCRRILFWDGQPTYLVPKFVEVLNEFYGYSLPAVFDSLHYFTNDILNQGGDALTFSLNPIVGIDPGAVQDMTTIRMRPGAKWLIRKPRENMVFSEPPKEAAAAAGQAVQTMIALMNDVANVAPFSGTSAGKSRGKAIQTMGGMQMVASENLVQVDDVIQGLEDLWLDPMLARMYNFTQQCLDDPVKLSIEGLAGASWMEKDCCRDDVMGQFSFRWQASVSNYNAQVRSQQLTGFLQIVARIPPQVFQQANKQLDLAYIVQSIWKDGFQLPDWERVVRDQLPVRALSPELEDEMFLQGRGDEVMVSPADKDKIHMRVHDELLKKGSGLPKECRQQVIDHIQEHTHSMITKQMLASMQAAGQGLPGRPGAPGQPGQTGLPPQMLGAAMGQGPGAGLLAGPQAPGRVAATNDMGDVQRQMGRPPGFPGGLPGGNGGMPG